MIKKFVSLLLVIVMLFSMSFTAVAIEISQTKPVLLEEYESEVGTYYRYALSYHNAIWHSIIFIPDNNQKISFTATSLNKDDDELYESMIEFSETKNPVDYLKDGFASLECASITNMSDFVLSDNNQASDDAMPRDAVQRDFMTAMRNIYGNEYERILYRDSTYKGVDEVIVHEDLVYSCNKKGSLVFDAGTPLSAISLAVTKLTNLSITLSAISLALSVAGDVIDAYATIDTYILKADFGRWTTIDDGSYVYTMTNKVYTHVGINERNNENDVQLEESNPELIYMPSATYYKDYSAQTDDAYYAYMN